MMRGVRASGFGFIVSGRSFLLTKSESKGVGSGVVLDVHVNGQLIGVIESVGKEWIHPYNSFRFKTKHSAAESLYHHVIQDDLVTVKEIDWVKIRRRIEDRLRKDPSSLKEIAKFLKFV